MIGNVTAGTNLFDLENETFVHIKHQEGKSRGLLDGFVKSNAEETYGNLSVQDSDKLFRITIKKLQ